jgi:branched-subunit amino acid aminotransferase/4-amino-4-deoxychorismate lyase
LKYILFNFELIPESKFQLPISNRAFQYSDGAFETMLFVDGEVRFLEAHLIRLKRAAKILKIELPQPLFNQETVAFWIEKLLTENQLSESVRIKIKIWRSGKGLYTPQENAAEVLITAEPQLVTPVIIETSDFANSVCTQYSNYSFFKGPNSMQYVLAGLEKKQRKLDEIILLSTEGFVSECLAANIFWVKNGMVFTPKTEAGCVAGIMRENLLRLFQANSIPFQEGFYLPDALLDAAFIFTSNVAGLKIIHQIRERAFDTKLPAYLQQYLFQYL